MQISCQSVLFEKNQKVMSFSLAQRKELKETSTPSKSSPIWEDLTRKSQHADDFLTVLVSRDTRCLFYIPAVAAPWKGAHIEAVIFICAPADKKSWRTPKGRKLESHTKTLTKGGLCPESITSLPYREGLGLGGCLFASFSAPEKVRNLFLLRTRRIRWL